MKCEAHPKKDWPHGNCPGPGIPDSAQVSMLVHQRDKLRQQVKELQALRSHEVRCLLEALKEARST